MQISGLTALLSAMADERIPQDETREDKIKRIKRMIQDEEYLTHERLDSALAKLLEEIEHE